MIHPIYIIGAANNVIIINLLVCLHKHSFFSRSKVSLTYFWGHETELVYEY